MKGDRKIFTPKVSKVLSNQARLLTMQRARDEKLGEAHGEAFFGRAYGINKRHDMTR